MNDLTPYLEHYALISLEKQHKLAQLIGEHLAEPDLENGRIRFHQDLEFPLQILGTESDNTLTFLWAWSEEQPEIPLNLLSSAFYLKNWGEERNLLEFSSPSIDLNRADGRIISLIASELCKASCYYQDPYEGGAIFYLLSGEAIDQQPSLDIEGLCRQFSYLMSLAELNHKETLLSYLREKGLTFSDTDAIVQGELESGESLFAEFDDSGMLLSINGKEIVAAL